MSQLSEVDGEAAAHMKALLCAAEQEAVMGTENTIRVTRSQGAEFRWNPKMNDKDGPHIAVQKIRMLFYVTKISLKRTLIVMFYANHIQPKLDSTL